MHRRAEYGVAAHWKYKENGRGGVDTDRLGDLDDMNWVRQLLDWQSEVEDPGEFLESLRFEINRAEVYVFTPRGDVIALPVGATPVDFAYAVHTEVGHRTIGARVNGRLVPLESTLDNADVVEIFTSKAPTAGPVARLAGLREVTAGAQQDPAVVHQGAPRGGDRARQGADRQADAQGGPAAQAGALPRVADRRSAIHFQLADVSALYAAVGEGNLSAQAVVRRVIELHGGEDGAAEDLAEGVTHHHVAAALARRRHRATPASSSRARPTSGSSSRSAARRCRRRRDPRLRHQGRRRVGAPPRLHERRRAASASPSGCSTSSGRRRAQSTFLVNIQVEALDRARLLSDITMVLSDAHVNILSATLSTSRDRVAKSRFTFEMAEAKHLDTVLARRPRRPRRLRRLPRHAVGGGSPLRRDTRLAGYPVTCRPLQPLRSAGSACVV